MNAQIIAYKTKKARPVIDWDWMRCEVEPESAEIEVLGTIAAGQPIEALPYPQTISIPKDMVGRFETYALRVEGNSMVKAGIHDGDILIVDRSLEPRDKKIVIAIVNGDLTVKRIRKVKNKVYLEPESNEFKPIEISETTYCQVWGVVTHAIHKV